MDKEELMIAAVVDNLRRYQADTKTPDVDIAYAIKNLAVGLEFLREYNRKNNV